MDEGGRRNTSGQKEKRARLSRGGCRCVKGTDRLPRHTAAFAERDVTQCTGQPCLQALPRRTLSCVQAGPNGPPGA